MNYFGLAIRQNVGGGGMFNEKIYYNADLKGF